MEENIRESVREKKSLPLYDIEELKYIMKPVGKSIYKSEEKVEKPWQKKIQCKICGEFYTRSNPTNHKKTKIHKAYADMNSKLVKLLVDKEK